jgi:hypothetical protein
MDLRENGCRNKQEYFIEIPCPLREFDDSGNKRGKKSDNQPAIDKIIYPDLVCHLLLLTDLRIATNYPFTHILINLFLRFFLKKKDLRLAGYLCLSCGNPCFILIKKPVLRSGNLPLQADVHY